mmetsp:Transcript_17319/g.26474  ORF Transcript_17319/g.26474 Transcript_17319/m.26474 type:complete len:377 (+) Transcript_17319:50-1180(+)
MSEKISWKDSNLALIGSELDHKIKEAAAEGEEQWQGLGEGEGTFVWRIESFRVVPWPKHKYGRFHEGDSYIVLHSQKEGEDDPKLLHDIHIWIGSKSSQDEYGTAAYKMVECDDFLGGAAIQHRQVQGSESAEFKSYFGLLMYLAGGVASGFRHVEPTVETPHLYLVKGTQKAMSLTQVDVSKDSLNQGDVYILSLGKEKVWIWNGEKANPDEKGRASVIAEGMATEGTAIVLDSGDNDGAEDAAEFWSILGDGEIKSAEEGGEDTEVEAFIPKLYKLSSAGSEFVADAEPVKIGFGKPQLKINKALLVSSDVFLVDTGFSLYVWVGKTSDRSERLAALGQADAYCGENGRPIGLPVQLLKEGYESYFFKNMLHEA